MNIVHSLALAGVAAVAFAAVVEAPPRLVRVIGDQGARPYRFEGAEGTAIDARSAVFTVANSRNSSPGPAMPCDVGPLPVNRYPVTISGAARVRLMRALVRGRVPQRSDWRDSYCNSAAISFRRAPGGVIDGARIDGAWDAVRASEGSGGLTLRGSWVSNVRDDLFENDYLYAAAVHDTLVDGAFQGLSMKPGGARAKGIESSAAVEISGLLIRLGEYPYKGRMLSGALVKSGPRFPPVSIRNSMVAVDYRGGGTFADYWRRSWSGLAASSGNSFLWLSDASIPPDFPMPPPGFVVVKGAAARAIWRAARSNWIDCHPTVARLPTDRRAVASACRRDRWGGQGR